MFQRFQVKLCQKHQSRNLPVQILEKIKQIRLNPARCKCLNRLLGADMIYNEIKVVDTETCQIPGTQISDSS